MTTRLMLYNGALRALGERKLASLTENREPRRVLDDIWESDAYDDWLEQGFWKFAIRTVRLEYSPSVEPPFGHQYAFDRPNDFVRTVSVSSDGDFIQPLTRYSEEADFWFASIPVIYVRYVSNDTAYGADMSLWPASFTEWVKTSLALKACERLTQNASKLAALEKQARRALIDARSKDAMEDPTRFPPPGSWVLSRNRMTGRASGWSTRG